MLGTGLDRHNGLIRISLDSLIQYDAQAIQRGSLQRLRTTAVAIDFKAALAEQLLHDCLGFLPYYPVVLILFLLLAVPGVKVELGGSVLCRY